ncbi:MAG: LytR family transcriptional regulator, partial [Desulfosporosinus sp.]|nr:LytR family transcriptional regulator [Desulfosporosinus sp.]
KEFLQVKTLPKLPGLISQITKCTETNLSVGQLWSLSNILLRFKNPDINSQTLPGNFLIEEDVSYWKVNPRKAPAPVKRLIEEGKTASVFFQ